MISVCEQTARSHISVPRFVVPFRWSRRGSRYPNYPKVPKFRDARNRCCIHSKNQTKRFYHGLIPLDDANGIANSEDPDQTAPLGAV